MELKFIKKLPGGSNCEADLFRYRTYDIVVKHCGNKSFQHEFGKLVMKDYFRIKNYIASAGVIVPETYDVFLSDYENADLYIVESYMGKSLRDIIKNIKDLEIINKHVRECREFIKNLPQDVPLDINPGNLIVSNSKYVSLIDFIPPDQWRYRGTKWEKDMIQAFETTSKDFDYKGKRHAYFSTDGRLKRFDIHVRGLLSDD